MTADGASCHRFACQAMGTRFECLLADDGRGLPELTAIAEAALAEVTLLDERLSRFRRDSLVSELVRRAGGLQPLRVDADTIDLFEECLAIWAASDGLFDVTVGDAWGATRSEPTATAGSEPSAAIELDRQGHTISLRRGTALDLGGIAKGHAIDVALRTLREAGVATALIHGGTSAVGALGAPPDRKGWRIEIAVPASIDHAQVVAACAASGRFASCRSAGTGGSTIAVELRDECLAVSAPHGRVVDGRHHIVDPRTMAPADCAAIAAVVGPSCRTCDGWTKPVLIEHRRPRGLAGAFEVVVASPSWR